jgi:FAD:protein FMN transferase
MLVQLVVTDPEKIDDARQLLAHELTELDLACSRFRPDSEVVAIGRADGHAGAEGQYSTTVSPLLAEAIAVSLRAASLTDGDVDPTVGAAISALGYDRDFGRVPVTGPALPVQVRTIPGWRSVTLDPVSRQLTVPAGIQLDLGATVKGWAADRCAVRIADKLGCGALVSLGGDTAVAGEPPAGGWRIRVQDVTGMPDEPAEGPSTVVAIREGGLATSSTAARRWQRGGDILHHILDPRTGMPAAPVWRTVSVAAASCADANTAATAAIIRGRQALPWLTGLKLPARLVGTDGDVLTVAGWPADPADPAEAGAGRPGRR